MKIAAYMRVSTDRQKLDMQEKAIEDWLKINHPHSKPKIFKDIAKSGKNFNRDGWQKLSKKIDNGEFEMLVVYKLDRIIRNTREAIKLIMKYDDIGLKFISVTQPMFSDGFPFRHAMIAMFAELAQMERELLIERIKAGLAATKKDLGRPKSIKDFTASKVIEMKIAGKSIREISKELGISKSSVGRILK